MVNREFLKTLTILYIEDDEDIQKSIFESFTNFFKKVFLASNGDEGLETFIEHKKDIDIIISDINMPKLTGIEMLKKIRERKENIPIIFTTAYTDTKYLLDAINLNVSEYVIKPYLLTDVLKKIEHICEEIYYIKVAKRQEKELKDYLEIIDKVAIISKTDLKGNITFVNDIFCEVSGYDEKELIGKPHNLLRHPDMPKEAFKGLWQDIKENKIWKGKVKNKAKDGEPYFVNASIFPMYNENEEKTGYMGIRFLTTDEENEKRNFKKQVLTNIQEYKKKELQLNNEITILKKQIVNADNIIHLQESLDMERQKKIRLHSQLVCYEDEITELKSNLFEQKKNFRIKAEEIVKKLKILQEKNESLKSISYSLHTDLKDYRQEVKKLNERVDEQNKIISNLRDVIKFRESQMSQAGLSLTIDR